MIPEKDIRDIQAYITGLMPSFRIEKFEARLKDPEFKAKYDELKPILVAIETLNAKNKIKNIVNEISAEDLIDLEPMITTEVKKGKTIPLFFRFAAAASIVLLGIIGWDSYNLSRNKIIGDSFENFQNEVRGKNNLECPNKDAMAVFNNSRYDEFIKLLKNSPKTTCNNYYLGISYLKYKDSEKAILLLIESSNDTLNIDNRYYQQNAEFYLSVAYLQAHKEEKAKEILQKIILEEEHENKLSAIKVLDKLNKKPILFRIKAFD